MADYVQKLFGLGAKNNMLRVLRKIEGFMMKILYPNITGKVQYSAWLNRDKIQPAFGLDPDMMGRFPNDDPGNSIIRGIVFDASTYNSIYSGSVVQPTSFRTLIICRI